jgi:NAD(P)-dependent dehydrogenase (short-subunit alcohol dehydrogenase family)
MRLNSRARSCASAISGDVSTRCSTYDGFRAYCQSKLALVMFTFDLAEEIKGSGVTVNCLHPATLMNTRMVIESGFKPQSSVEEGADAILHVATSRMANRSLFRRQATRAGSRPGL